MKSLHLLFCLVVAVAATQRNSYQDLEPSLIAIPPSAPSLSLLQTTETSSSVVLAEVSSTVESEAAAQQSADALARIRKAITDKARAAQEAEDARIEMIVQQRLADMQKLQAAALPQKAAVEPSLAETSATAFISTAAHASAATTDGPGGDALLASRAAQEQDQLQVAKDQLEAAIMAKVHQVDGETKWVQDVKDIINQYQEKISLVEGNVHALRLDVEDLLQKKRQVENLEIQNELGSKVNVAKDDLASVDKAAGGLEDRKQDMAEIKDKLAASIQAIQAQIAELKGEQAAAAQNALSLNDPVQSLEAATAAAQQFTSTKSLASTPGAGVGANAFFVETAASSLADFPEDLNLGNDLDMELGDGSPSFTQPPSEGNAIDDLIKRARLNMDNIY